MTSLRSRADTSVLSSIRRLRRRRFPLFCVVRGYPVSDNGRPVGQCTHQARRPFRLKTAVFLWPGIDGRGAHSRCANGLQDRSRRPPSERRRCPRGRHVGNLPRRRVLQRGQRGCLWLRALKMLSVGVAEPRRVPRARESHPGLQWPASESAALETFSLQCSLRSSCGDAASESNGGGERGKHR